MSSTPICIRKKMRFGCGKSSMPEDIRIAKNIKSLCNDY